jgi:hypothetical protein
MSSYTYQHYLPAGHQRLFSNQAGSGEFVFKYDKTKSVVYSNSQKPKNHGGKSHLYSYPNSLCDSDEQTYLEQKYFSQDGDFVAVVKKLLSSKEVDVTDIYQITKYIANMNNRHPSTLETQEHDITKMALEYLFFFDSKLTDFFKSEVEFIPSDEGEFIKIMSLSYMLRSIVENLDELCNISMNFLFSEHEEFILSDIPFVGISNELSLLNTSKLSPENQYLLPLSKTLCAHLNMSGQELKAYIVDGQKVKIINRLQILSAKKFVVASSLEILCKNLDENNIRYEVK